MGYIVFVCVAFLGWLGYVVYTDEVERFFIVLVVFKIVPVVFALSIAIWALCVAWDDRLHHAHRLLSFMQKLTRRLKPKPVQFPAQPLQSQTSW